MAVVGEAHVIVRAITDKVKDDIRRAFSDANSGAGDAGKKGGKAYGDEFAKSATKSITESLTEVLKELQEVAETSGKDAGGKFGGGFASGVTTAGRDAARALGDSFNSELASRLDFSSAFDGLRGQAADAGSIFARDFADSFGRDLDARLNDAFGDSMDDIVTRAGFAGADAADNFGSAFDRVNGLVIVDWTILENGSMVAGARAGQNFADGFNLGWSSKVVIDWDVIVDDARDAGSRSADAFGGSFDRDLQGPFDRVRQRIRDLFNDNNRAAGGGGGRGGSHFWAFKFWEDGWKGAAEKANVSFTRLFGSFALLGPAISGLIGMISAAASGLFAMASAALSAAPALVVLPGLMMAAAQAGGAMKLAFSGVGDAISAGMKAAKEDVAGTGAATAAAQRAVRDATERLAEAQEDGARRVQEAQSRVALAYEDAAERSRDAAMKVQDAERDLAEAINDSRNAQEALNRAREDAIEDLQQLSFSAEEAALSEERAAIRLEEAHARLVEASYLPADDKTRREAELSYKEAELSFRQAKDRNLDMAKAQEEAARAGLEGHNKVIDATNDLNAANQKVADQEFALAEARRDQAMVERDNARAIAEAQQGVVDAQRQSARAIEDAAQALADANARVNEGTAASKAYKSALDDLTPSQRRFAEWAIAHEGLLDNLKEAVASGFLFQLSSHVDQFIAAGGMSIIENQLRETGDILGDTTHSLGNFLSSAEGLGRIDAIMAGNNKTLRILSEAVAPLADLLTAVGVALQPVTQRFAQWVADIIKAKAEIYGTNDGIEKMTGTFNKAGDVAAQLGEIFGNLFGAFRNLGAAAMPAGLGLLDSFTKATQKFEEFTARIREDGSAAQFFEGAADNLRAIGRLITVIGEEFFSLGDNAGVGGFADALIPGVRAMGDMADQLIEFAPAVGELLSTVGEIMAVLFDAGALEWFLKTLQAVADVLLWIASSGVVQALLHAFGPLHGILRGLGFAALVLGPIFLVLGGIFMSMGRTVKMLFKALGAIWRILKPIINTVRIFAAIMGIPLGPILLIVGALAALGAAFVIAYKRSETFRNFINGIGSGIREAFGGLVDWVRGVWDGFFAAVIDPVRDTWNELLGHSIIPDIVNGIQEWFGKLAGIVGPIFEGVKTIITTIFDAIKLYIEVWAAVFGFVFDNIIKPVFSLAVTFFEAWWAGVKIIFDFVVAGFEFLGGVLSDVWSGIIQPAFAAGKDFISAVWDTGLKVVFAAIQAGMDALGKALKWVWENVIQPAFNAGKGFINMQWEGIKVIFGWLKAGMEALGSGLKWVWENVIQPAFNAGKKFINDVWLGLQVIFGWIKAGFEAMGTGLKWVWDNIVKPTFNFFKEGAQFLWEKISDVGGWIRGAFDSLGGKIRGVWNDLIAPTFTWFKEGAQALWDKAKTVVDNIMGKFGEVGGFLQDQYVEYIDPVISSIKDAFQSIQDKAGDVVDGVKTIFTKLKDAPKEGIKNLIGNMNRFLIGNLNKVLGVFNFSIPEIPVPQFASGGFVRGKGGPRDDKILARLSNGEYVVNAAATRANKPILEAINRGGGKQVARTVAPRGGALDAIKAKMPKIGAVVDKVTLSPKEIAEAAEKAFKEGVAKALESTVRPFFNTYVQPKDKMPWMLPHLALGNFIDAVKDWGDQAEKTLSPVITDMPPGSSGKYGGVKPHVAAAGDLIAKLFDVRDIGGVAGRSNKSDHPRGLALDFMVYKDKLKGDKIAKFVMDNQRALAMKYIIWYSRIASAGGNWRPYRHPSGMSNFTLDHKDHPHVSFLDSARSTRGGATAGGTAAIDSIMSVAARMGADPFDTNVIMKAVTDKGKVTIGEDKLRRLFEKLFDIRDRRDRGIGGAAQALSRVGVFDTGGILKSGNLSFNLSGRPERVLSPRQTEAFDAVFARDDGLLARLIESSRTESGGMADAVRASAAREERIISLLTEISDRVSSGDQFVVQPAPGMDERELANEVSRRVAFRRRRGA